jgi:hypothetical protein
MQKHFFLGRAIARATCTTFLVVFPHTPTPKPIPKVSMILKYSR